MIIYMYTSVCYTGIFQRVTCSRFSWIEPNPQEFYPSRNSERLGTGTVQFNSLSSSLNWVALIWHTLLLVFHVSLLITFMYAWLHGTFSTATQIHENVTYRNLFFSESATNSPIKNFPLYGIHMREFKIGCASSHDVLSHGCTY